MENGDVANGDNNKIIFMPPRLQHGLPHGLNQINKSDLETQENQN